MPNQSDIKEEIGRRVSKLFEESGRDQGLFVQYLEKIFSAKPKSLVSEFVDEFLEGAPQKNAMRDLRAMLGPEYLATCVEHYDLDRGRVQQAEVREFIIQQIKEAASQVAPNVVKKIEALQGGARHQNEVKVMSVGDIILREATFKKSLEGLRAICITSLTDREKVNKHTQALRAIIDGETNFAEQLDGTVKEAFLSLYQGVNEPDALVEAYWQDLFEASQQRGESTAFKSDLKLGEVRDFLRERLLLEAGEMRNLAVERGMAPYHLDEFDDEFALSGAGEWSNNICEHVLQESSLAFRPMPAAIAGGAGENPSPVLIRGAVISGQLVLQVAPLLHAPAAAGESSAGLLLKHWQPLATSDLSKVTFSNPYQHRLEQWHWDKDKQRLTRRCQPPGEALSFECLECAKQPLGWVSKGDNAFFEGEKISSEVTAVASTAFKALVANDLKVLAVALKEFPVVQDLEFNPAICPVDLQPAAIILNRVAASLPLQVAHENQVNIAVKEVEAAALTQVRQWDMHPQIAEKVSELIIQGAMKGEMIRLREGIKWSPASDEAFTKLRDALRAAPNIEISGDQGAALGRLYQMGAISKVESLQAQLEDAMNAMYRAADSREQALAVMREVVMLKKPGAEVIRPDQTTLRQAAHELREVFEPVNLERKLAHSLMVYASRVEEYECWHQLCGNSDKEDSAFHQLASLQHTEEDRRYGLCQQGDRLRNTILTHCQTLLQLAQAQAKTRVEAEDPDDRMGTYRCYYRETLNELVQGRLQKEWHFSKQLLARAVRRAKALPAELNIVSEGAFVYSNDVESSLLTWLTEEAQIPAENDDIEAKVTDIFLQQLQEKAVDSYKALVVGAHRHLNYAEARDLCRDFIAHHIHDQAPKSRLNLMYEYARASVAGGDHRPFSHFTNRKLHIGYDDDMLRRSAPMQRLGQAISLHTASLEDVKDNNSQKVRDFVLEAIKDPNRVSFCDNAEYLQRLYAFAQTMYENESLEAYQEFCIEQQRRKEAGEELQEDWTDEQKHTTVELQLIKHPDDYNEDDKHLFNQAKQRIESEAGAAGYPKLAHEIEREARLAVTVTRPLNKQELLDELENLRALTVARSVALAGGYRAAWIGADPKAGAKGWHARLNLLTSEYRKKVQMHFAQAFEHHATETHPRDLPPTARWQYMANPDKSSLGMYKDDSDQQYMLFNYFNAQGMAEWQRRLKVIPWKVTKGVMQETRIYASGFRTTVTHPKGALDNIRLLQGKMEHLRIKVAPGEEQVALAHVRAAWEAGGFKSIDVVFDESVPQAYKDYLVKNFQREQAEQLEQEEKAARKAQGEHLKQALAELVEGMTQDCDREAQEAKTSRSDKFQVLYNGTRDASLIIPKPKAESSEVSSSFNMRMGG